MHKDFYYKLFLSFADVLDHLAHVSHVVDVLEFGRSRQQFFRDLLEDLKSSEDDWLGVGAFGCEERVEDFEGCG